MFWLPIIWDIEGDIDVSDTIFYWFCCFLDLAPVWIISIISAIIVFLIFYKTKQRRRRR